MWKIENHIVSLLVLSNFILQGILWVCMICNVSANMELTVTGIQCYSCSSSNDRKCVEKQNDVDKLINCETACINAILSDGSTFRGCSSDLSELGWKQETCKDDVCNADVFPKDRLSCYHCSGSQCANIDTVPRTDSLICQNYLENDTCYIDIRSDTNIKRGCTSNGKEEGSNHRTTCAQPFCNDDPAVGKLTCWECDSNLADEVSCKLGKEDDGSMGKCEMDIVFGSRGFCYLLHHEEYVRRGCSDGAELEINEKYTETCEESLCNNQDTLISHCYECDSDRDNGCMFLDNDKLTVAKCPPGKSSCFACRDFGNIVKRGCGQPDQCIGACFPCWNGSLCNSNPMYECYSCDSLSDSDCDLLGHPDMIDREICDSGCQVSLQNDVLYRGCLNQGSPCSEDNLCSPCYGDRCNDYYIDMECGIVKFIDSQESFSSTEDSVDDVD